MTAVAIFAAKSHSLSRSQSSRDTLERAWRAPRPPRRNQPVPRPPLTAQQQSLVTDNRCLAWDFLYRHCPPMETDQRNDAFQDLMIGLCEAARRYNPGRISAITGKPVAFSTYAWWWLKQSWGTRVREFARQTPAGAPMLFSQVEVARRRAGSTGRDGCSFTEHLVNPASIPTVTNDDQQCLEDADLAREAQKRLSARQWEVARLRFWEGWTRVETAKHFGKSSEWVRQTEIRIGELLEGWLRERGARGVSEREVRERVRAERE